MRREHHEMPVKKASAGSKSRKVFGQGRTPTPTIRAGLYARVSTHDQQTLPMQNRAMREYAARRGWAIARQVKEVGSGSSQRQLREKLMEAAIRVVLSTDAGLLAFAVAEAQAADLPVKAN